MDKICLLFPGQASQYVGMGKKLYNNYQFVREYFDLANDILEFDIKSLCINGSIEELSKTENTQPSLVLCSYALYKIYMNEIGIKPVIAAGHSIGEISALTCAGVIDFPDALRITQKRALFMRDAVPSGFGKMAAVSNLKKDDIEQLLNKISNKQDKVIIANYNSPEQFIISGSSTAIEKASEHLKENGAKVIPLNVSGPFHSPYMKEAAFNFKNEISKYSFKKFDFSVVSNVTAEIYSDNDKIEELLVKQIESPVRWIESMQYLCNQNIDCYIEIGPKNILKNIMKSNVPNGKVYCFDNENDFKELKNNQNESRNENIIISNIKINFLGKCLAIAVSTKNNNWNDDEYREGVIKPYKKIQEMLLSFEKENKAVNDNEIFEAIKMLKSVFTTKKTDITEQINRYKQIFPITGLEKDQYEKIIGISIFSDK